MRGLIVTSDAGLQLAISNSLAGHDLAAEWSSSSGAALGRLVQVPLPAFVLLDCDMAASAAVLEAVRSARTLVDLPMIVLTSRGRMAAKAATDGKGAFTYESFPIKNLGLEVQRVGRRG